MRQIKSVIVGFGGMGSYHARELVGKNKYVETYGVYDLAEEKRVAAQGEGFRVYESYAAVLADPAVEAVVIATPNDSHKELCVQALKAGKHVVCEKPVMLSVADFDEVVAVAQQQERVFMTHQNRRWDADFLVIRSLYQQQTLGEVFQLESRVHGANGIPGDWRHLAAQGGGMLLDWGVHLLDQLLFLVDSPVVRVSADLSYVLGDEVDDGFVSQLLFENGVRAQVEVGTSNFIKLPRWYIKGYQGTGIIYDWDLSGELVLAKATEVKHEPVPIQAGQGLTKTMAPPSEEMTERRELPHASAEFPEFYHNFYQVVREAGTPVVKNNEVRNCLVLIETIFAAAATGRTITL